MSDYSLVVFDWDGTLMDSTKAIVKAIQAACADSQLPVPDEERASWVIGLSLEPALNHAVPELTDEKRPYFLERYRHHYLSRDPKLVLFEGVPEMLETLRQQGVAMAIATGKSRVGLDRVLRNTGIGDFFMATRCADETFGKPHPGMLHEIMAVIGVEKSSVIMVGDTSHDLQMAANAGVHGLGVSYGAHSEQALRLQPHQALVADVLSVNQWLSKKTRPWAPVEI